ncbi:hypothetical protein ACFSHP_20755 [Novosphingobium panipatense]
MREFFIDNALHWLDEYRFDGLRLDAVHAIEDHSSLHFLDELGQRIRARGYERPIHLVTEDERNLARYFAPDAPYDGTWNDDWHHAAHCLLTGEDESYYAPFAVDPVGDLATALADGYVEQGQVRKNGDAEGRGEPSSTLPRTAFVNFLSNHDQVGNRARGERLHHLTDDAHAYRVVTALTLLAPSRPCCSWERSSSPKLLPVLRRFRRRSGRGRPQGPRTRVRKIQQLRGEVPDPVSRSTFETSKIGSPSRSAAGTPKLHP